MVALPALRYPLHIQRLAEHQHGPPRYASLRHMLSVLASEVGEPFALVYDEIPMQGEVRCCLTA